MAVGCQWPKSCVTEELWTQLLEMKEPDLTAYVKNWIGDLLTQAIVDVFKIKKTAATVDGSMRKPFTTLHRASVSGEDGFFTWPLGVLDIDRLSTQRCG